MHHVARLTSLLESTRSLVVLFGCWGAAFAQTGFDSSVQIMPGELSAKPPACREWPFSTPGRHVNDGPILAIAYDKVHYSDTPEAWNMRLVLGIAGVVATFGIFYLVEHVFHFSRDVVQTFIFLKLAVAGHLTIFLTRMRGPFWSSRAGADPIVDGDRYQNAGNIGRCVRRVHVTNHVALSAAGLGICAGLVCRERRNQARRMRVFEEGPGLLARLNRRF